MRIRNCAMLAGTCAAAAISGSSYAENIALNTGATWATYGDTQASDTATHIVGLPGWMFDGIHPAFPYVGDFTDLTFDVVHFAYTTWTQDATVTSVTVKPTLDGEYTLQEFNIQTLVSGGIATNDADWVTVDTVSDFGTGTALDPYLDGGVYVFTPGSPLTTQGIRIEVTRSSEFAQNGLGGPGSNGLVMRMSEIEVEGSFIPEPATLGLFAVGLATLTLRRRR